MQKIRTKAQMREQMKIKTLSIHPADAAEKSSSASRLAEQSQQFIHAKSVMLYMSIPGELDVSDLIARAIDMSKTVLLPRVDLSTKTMSAVAISSVDDEMTTGPFGIREPASGQSFPPEEIDMIIIPARAFDTDGNRLGRGGGYYDRFLNSNDISQKAVRCGIGFTEQIIERIPVDEHDQCMDMLVTDRDIMTF